MQRGVRLARFGLLHDAHGLGHRVKSAIRDGVPAVRDVLVYMEPFEP